MFSSLAYFLIASLCSGLVHISMGTRPALRLFWRSRDLRLASGFTLRTHQGCPKDGAQFPRLPAPQRTQFQSLLFNSKFTPPTEITSSIGFTFLIFPFFLFNYFFFSYFFNHGQTYGMHLTKKRIDQKSKSFTESFRWAAHSMTICFSFGLSYIWPKSIWNKFRSHDYLYSDFVIYKESSPINLLEKIYEFENAKELQETDWKVAA